MSKQVLLKKDFEEFKKPNNDAVQGNLRRIKELERKIDLSDVTEKLTIRVKTLESLFEDFSKDILRKYGDMM